MKLRGKILSFLLTLSLIVSVFPSFVVANAAGWSQPGGGGSSAYTPGQFTYVYLNSEIVMRISASCVTDTLSDDQLYCESVRYGNGFTTVHEYPLFIRATHKSDGNNPAAYTYVPTAEYTNDATEICKRIDNLEKNINNSDRRGWRTGHNQEFWNKGVITYRANKLAEAGDVNFVDSVYLEDAVLKVKNLYDKGVISATELRDFWYFYTRMAAVARYSKDGESAGNTSFTTGMSDELNWHFIGVDPNNTARNNGKVNSNAVLRDGSGKRAAMMQSGYLIALYAVYGNAPFREITSSNFSKLEGDDKHHLFANGYTSFEFDRCWTDKLQNFENPYLLVSTHTWAELHSFYGNDARNPYQETWHHTNARGIGWDVIPKLANTLKPAYTYGKRDQNGEVINAEMNKWTVVPRCNGVSDGWAYYEITTGGGGILEPPALPDAENAQLEVTYNAYLSNGSSDTDYTKESNNFGDNGHVMTDTVFLSDVMSKDEIIKSIDSRAFDFDNDEDYLDTKVESSIHLSTPFADTTYDLKKLEYRIVDAAGSIRDSDSKEIIYASGTGSVSDGTISVSGKNFKKVFGDVSGRYYVIQKHEVKNTSLDTGSYKDNTGTHDYYVYKSSDDGKSITTTNKKLTEAKDNNDLDSGNNTRDKISEWGSTAYPASTYCLKIEDGYFPITMEDGTYYLWFNQYINNKLVQVRADYVSTYTKDDVRKNTNDTLKSVKMEEYLVDKNYSTDAMLGSDKSKLYSMIDNYATNEWGNTYNRANCYRPETSTTNEVVQITDSSHAVGELYAYFDVKEDGKQERHVGTRDRKGYSYSLGSLFNSEAEFYQNLNAYRYSSEGAEFDSNYNSWSGDWLYNRKNNSIFSNDFLSNTKSKVFFRTVILKTVPILATDNSGNGVTYLNSDLPVIVTSYDNNLGINTSINKSNLYYTNFNEYKNRREWIIPVVTNFNKVTHFATKYLRRSGTDIASMRDYYKSSTEYPANVTTYDPNKGNRYYYAFSNKLVPAYGAEADLHADIGIAEINKDGKGIDLATGYRLSDSESEVTAGTLASYKYNWTRIGRKYMQAAFTKLLANYNKYLYAQRGKIDTSLTPVVSNWYYTSATVSSKCNDYTMNSGSINPDTYVGYTDEKKSVSIDNGFIRFGKTISPLGNRRILYNNQGVPTALQVNTISARINVSDFKDTSLANIDEINLIAPSIQSSYDVPINYTIKSHKTNNISKKAVGSSLTRTPDNKEISLSYHYGTTETIADMIKYGGTTWAKDKVIIGVYPEVKMWAEGDKSDGQGPGGVTSYDPVVTVGAKQRYIPAMTYTTVKFGDLSTNVNVIGTAVAYDTRAKALAQKLGTVDTQVLYSGSGITGTTTTTMNNDSTIQSYVLDFKGSGTINKVNVKEAWGNKGYSSSKAATRAMEVLLGNFNVSQVNKLGIYNGGSSSDKYKEFEIDTNVNNQTLSIDSSTLSRDVIGYNITMQGGRVTVVNVIAFSAVNSTAYDIGTFKVDGTTVTYSSHRDASSISISNDSVALNAAKTYANGLTSTTGRNIAANKIKQLLLNMKLIGDDNIVSKAFEWGTGVELPYETVNGVKNYKITSTAPAVLATYAGNKYQGSDGLMHDFTVTANHKSYSEDCSVLQIRSYSAKVKTSSAKGTFTEQIPINLGPATPADKNSYFTNGYKGFINVKAQIVAAKDITFADNTTLVKDKELFGSEYKHKLKNGSEIFITSGASKDDLDSAIPDFIIGDVPISEALTG